jgi:ERCC4-type nuclease
MSYLIVDKRERALDDQIALLSEKFFVIKEQFDFGGDYIIMGDNNKILAAIERKTFKDLAASIRDGRINDQITKMVTLREQTGCDLYFILEGRTAFPTDTNYFGRMCYKNLEGKLIHAQIRHGIPTIRSKDPSYTIKIIEKYIIGYRDVKEVVGGGEGDNKIVALDTIVQNNVALDTLIPAELKQKLPTKYESEVISAWKCLLPGIKLKTVRYVISKTDLVTLINGNVVLDELELTDNEKQKLRSIIALTKVDKFTEFLAAINGISKKYAADIMKVTSPLHLVNMSEAELTEMQVNDKRIGPSKAKKIFELINYINKD